MSNYVTAMRRGLDFSGRSSRREFWLFFLGCILLGIAAEGIRIFAESFAAWILFALLHVVPSWAVTVRRFHDIDWTGWWYPIFAASPFLGFFLLALSVDGRLSREQSLFILCVSLALIYVAPLALMGIVGLVRGTRGTNRYGLAPNEADPLNCQMAAGAGAGLVSHEVWQRRELVRLSELRARGSLNEDEFKILQARVLANGQGKTTPAAAKEIPLSEAWDQYWKSQQKRR